MFPMLVKRLIMLFGKTMGITGSAMSASPHSLPAANVMNTEAENIIPTQHPRENVSISAPNITTESAAYTIFASAPFLVHIRLIVTGRTRRIYSPSTLGFSRVE